MARSSGRARQYALAACMAAAISLERRLAVEPARGFVVRARQPEIRQADRVS